MPFIDDSALSRVAESVRQATAQITVAASQAGSEIMRTDDTALRQALDVGEIGGVVAVMGYLNGRYGQAASASDPAGGRVVQVAGLPADALAAAVLGLTTAIAGERLGSAERDLGNLGIGAFASFCCRAGTTYGAASASPAPVSPTTQPVAPASAAWTPVTTPTLPGAGNYRFSLTVPAAMASQIAAMSAAMQQGLTAKGWTNVTLYAPGASFPSDWPDTDPTELRIAATLPAGAASAATNPATSGVGKAWYQPAS